MATTTNFGWTTPDDTDLVKDGASAIRTLGSGIDTSLVDLKGGTTGQYLKKNSNTDLDYVWGDVASGGMELISTTTLTGASISLTSIPQTYKNLQIVCRLFLPATTNSGLRMRFNSDSTASRHKNFYSASEVYQFTYDATSVSISGNARNSSSTGMVVANIYDYTNTTTPKIGDQTAIWTETDANFSAIRSYFAYSQTGGITSLDFFPSSGNFTSGTLLLYGVK